ncbi:MAG: Ig-like domain-containing protein [bacterium]
MRLPLRSLATLAVAVGVATCSDSASTVVKPAIDGNGGVAQLGFVPVFSKEAAATYARLADFAINFDHVHVVVTRPPSEVVKDTLVAFKPGQAPITLELNVVVRTAGEVFNVSLDYLNIQSLLFHGEGTVQSHGTNQAAPPQQIVINYKGPGFNATRVVLSPKTVNVVPPLTAPFTVAAFDANNAPVANVPINWTTSDASIATITAGANPNTATLTPTGKRGTVTVTAQTPVAGVSDNAAVTISLPPTSITLVSGGGQTGKAGGGLAQPAVVRVVASDAVGVAGVTVTFAAPAGGKVGSASVTTDASGAASTSLALGGTLGAQSFVAATGTFSVSIPATATPGDPAVITVTSGNGQSDTLKHALKNPLVVKVTDAFGNAVPNVTVTWTRAGAGTLGAATSTTDTAGLASVTYTLGAAIGNETITASVTGIANPASFTVQAVATAPAAIAVVSGGGQSGRAGQPLPAPFVVHVVDDAGNPVSGAFVNWTSVNGTLPVARTTTDSAGNTSNTLTLGSTVGPASATATVGTRSVTFTATVQVGTVAKLVFRTVPANGAANQALNPAVQVELQDAGGNLSPATNPVTIAIGSNPAGGVLGGTLTRAAVAGVATFDDLTLSVNGTYTLVASSGGTPPATSNPLIIGAGSPSMLLIDPTTGNPIAGSPAISVTAGAQPPANAPVIKVVTATNVPIPFRPITISVTGPGSATFNVATDSAGILRFIGALRLAGVYTVTATGAGLLNSPRSATVTVLPAPAIQLAFSVVPQTVQPNVSAAYQVAVLDSIGNLVNIGAGSTIPINVTMSSNPPGATITNGGTVNAVAGLANYPALTLSLTGGYTLRATSPGVGDGLANVTVGPGAPAQSLIVVTPVGSTTVGTGLPANQYPSFKAVTSGNVGVPGVQVSFSVSSGSTCTLINPSTTTLTTDANGLATLTSAQLTVAVGAAGSCTILASTPADLTGKSTVLVAPTGAAVWTGTTSTSWIIGSNWLSGATPIATSQVFVPFYVPNQPALNGNTTIGGLTMEAGAAPSINLNDFTLTINGSVTSSSSVATTSGVGAVVLNAPGAATVSGIFFSPVTIGAISCTSAYSLNGLFGSNGLTVNCPLDLTSFPASITGNATIQNSGRLAMTQSGAIFTATGNVNFQGASEVGFMSNGAVAVGGGLTIQSATAYAPSGAHLTNFTGAGAQVLALSGGITASFRDFIINPGVSVSLTSPNAFNISVGGTFGQFGTLTIPGIASITTTGAATLTGTTTVNGALTLPATSNTSFASTSVTNGTGTLNVTPPCTRHTGALVTVTTNNAAGCTVAP